MYWSIFDTLMMVTGVLTSAIAFVPGITSKTRAGSVAVGALLVVAALITGSLSSFTYPQLVMVGPLIPIAVAIRLWFAARTPPTAPVDPAHVDVTDPEALAHDPATPAATLADLAYRFPALRSAIAENPATYAELRHWIVAAGERSPDPAPHEKPPGLLPSLAVLVVCLLLGGAGVIGTINAVNSGDIYGLWGAADTSDTYDTGYDAAIAGETVDETTADYNGWPTAASAEPIVAQPRNVPTVLVLDASGSMVRDVPTGGTRMEAARSATTTFVNGLSDGSRIGLTVFGTQTGNAVEDQAAGCQDVTTILPVGPVDKTELSAAVSSIVESGYTPIGLALQRAADQLPAAQEATIVLVSDGVDTCTPPPSCEIAASLKLAHPDLTIHTIGFLVDADEEAQAQLACIAAAAGGEFVEAGNAAQLAARLRIASDPDSLGDTVTPSGFHSMRIGMTVEQARAAEPGLTLTRTTVEYQYVKCSYATIRFRDGVLYDITPLLPAATAEGLAIGDDVTRAVELYGQPSAEQTGDLGTFQVFPATPGSANGYQVYYDASRRVVQIVLCGCGPGQNTTTDVAVWQIDFDGIGPISLGDTFEQAFAVAPLVHGDETSCTWRAELPDIPADGWIIAVSEWDDPNETITAVEVYQQQGNSGGLPRTWAGVGVGSTWAEVRAAHPDVSPMPGPLIGDVWIISGKDGNSIIFTPDETGQVVAVTVSTSPYPLYDVCL
ncbi:VWA domain-containing protein [Cryobacterium frigoriphilum]|uniref:VWA domain-containing protein n=1 Tax=Cryobacterium frigoriphilum TaxID=1259150 RepID=A0A4V3IQH6_9MICO|nr:VWA domain-containing protein [Cryobacterium frigoriphilum]TFD46350.1 VWA domain-containing protein [Cryobacterium frigoriphilum]